MFRGPRQPNDALSRPTPDWNRKAGEKYTAGTPNVWSILSADPERDLVFVPTGNAAPDYYAGERMTEADWTSIDAQLRASYALLKKAVSRSN